jgi:Tol biopolymer transport system component
VVEASGKKLDMTTFAPQEFVRWQLAKAGLTGPFINQAITRTLSASPASVRQPLASIALRSAPVRLELRPGQIAVPLAFDFLEQHLGKGTLNRLLPALADANVRTMGDAITTALRLNPVTLEPAWQKYVREWESLLASVQDAPDGELALWCGRDTDARTGSTIVRMRVNGKEAPFIGGGAWVSNAWPPHWSPDGKALAYAQGDNVSARVIVMDADRRTFRVVAEGLAGAPGVEWLPAAPQRLKIAGITTRVVNLDTSESIELVGVRHTWSPDGKWTAFQWPYPNPVIWIADADGRDARELARGDKLAWSPDSKRLAFLGLPSQLEQFYERQVQIADAATDSVITLTRGKDLVRLLTGTLYADEASSLTDLAWSPDGAMLAVGVAWSGGSAVVVMDASSGAVRAQWQWGWTRVGFPIEAWSADLRRLVVWLAPDSSAQSVPSLLDIQTGVQTDLSGMAFDWSPDGQWLAIAQQPSGLLLMRADLSVTRWLDTPACFDVAWRPEPRE